MSMSLKLKAINDDNYKEILKLTISKQQEDFMESIEECLKEASQYDNWRPVGLYDGEVPVGFAMYGLFLNEGTKGRVWLDRFLIDSAYQGKGYGEAGVRLLLHRLYKEYAYPKIYLSVYDHNTAAIALYTKIGFKFNGEEDTKGEKVMVVCLDKSLTI